MPKRAVLWLAGDPTEVRSFPKSQVNEQLGFDFSSVKGLLTTAVANQTPELYGCVITIAGVIDMLRVRWFFFFFFLKKNMGHPVTADFIDFHTHTVHKVHIWTFVAIRIR